MVIFRWILGISALLMAAGLSLTFMLYIVNGDDGWMKLVRRLRHWLYVLLMFWINVEIWRSVVLIIIHW